VEVQTICEVLVASADGLRSEGTGQPPAGMAPITAIFGISAQSSQRNSQSVKFAFYQSPYLAPLHPHSRTARTSSFFPNKTNTQQWLSHPGTTPSMLRSSIPAIALQPGCAARFWRRQLLNCGSWSQNFLRMPLQLRTAVHSADFDYPLEIYD
jgi:hypothetical protein